MCLGGPVCRFVWSGSWGVPTSPRGKEGKVQCLEVCARKRVVSETNLGILQAHTSDISAKCGGIWNRNSYCLLEGSRIGDR